MIRDLSPKLGLELGEEAGKFAVSFIPFVGPFLGPGASFIEAVADANKKRHAWYAALMKLGNAEAGPRVADRLQSSHDESGIAVPAWSAAMRGSSCKPLDARRGDQPSSAGHLGISERPL